MQPWCSLIAACGDDSEIGYVAVRHCKLGAVQPAIRGMGL
jgi:hypothetical protein